MQNVRTRPPGLPNFDDPPVTEVALSIQFAALSQFRNAHAGLYWDKIRKQYPVASEQSPLVPAFETFGTPHLPPRLQVQALATPPVSRHWFETADGEHLVQLQQDRILHNWRQRSSEMKYPRYESLCPKFEDEVDKLSAFLRAENLGELRPNQCEVTYINTISSTGAENPHDLARITPLWADHPGDALSPTPETTTIQTQFVLQREDGPFGRVYVNFTPAYRTTDHAPVVQLAVSARGRPSEETIPAAFALLDQLRTAIVQTFARVTTPIMHNRWGRTDVSG